MTSKYKQLFISEAEEKIANLNVAILGLEKEPNNINFANDAMRAVHTIKSSSAAMGFMEMSHLSHTMENLFEQTRTKGQALASQDIEILFQSVDALSASLDAIKKDGKELKLDSILQAFGSRESGSMENPLAFGGSSAGISLKSIETIKVNVKTLNTLMNLTEELLVAQMRFKEIIRKTEENSNKFDFKELKICCENFNRLTNDLQYQITQAHLVPVSQLFEQTPRIIRDLAKKQDKEIELSIIGQDIELDKTIMDCLGEPLIHLLRNAVDHGVLKKGKIILSAERLRDNVIITVTNEGKLIDWKKVIEIALKKNIISKEKGNEYFQNLTANNYKLTADLKNLLYQLSTKEEITEISGRGVGLGIVKSVVESLGGKIIIESQKNGSSFILSLPLTLAIIQALLVRAQNQTFAIPFSQVERLVRVPLVNIKKAFDQEVAVINEEDFPIIRLDEKFALEKKHQGIFLSEEEIQTIKYKLQAELMIITNPIKNDISDEAKKENTSQIAIIVDEVFSEQNIVVKPLKGILKQTKGFAGITLLGDGKPAMILDVNSLV